MTSVDDVAVTSADDVSVMTSPRADVSKRNLARDGTWRRVECVSSCAESSGGA